MLDDWFVDLAANALQIDRARINSDLAIGDIEQWDSVAHLSLIMEVEQYLGVQFDVDEIVAAESLGDIWQNLVLPAKRPETAS